MCDPGSRSATDSRVALGHRRQVDLAIGQLGLGVVLALDVGPQVAGELDDLARGGELRLPAGPVAAAGRGADQPNLGARAGGVGHLRGHRALPDQVVEAELVAGQRAGRLVRGAERLTGRPDGFVGLLGVLHLALVATRLVGHVLEPVEGRRLGPGGVEGLAPTGWWSRSACR